MKLLGHLLVASAMFAGVVRSEEAEDFFESSAVHLLDGAGWKEFSEKHDGFMAMFYAPWCGHCKSLKPDYVTAADHMQFSVGKFVAVDCTLEESKPVCEEHSVTGFPTLKWVGSSETLDYDGGRSSGDLISYVKAKTNDAEDFEGVDFKKLRVKQLKQILKARGVDCAGCTEKPDFVAKVKESVHLPKTSTLKKKSKLKTSLVNGRTVAQERRYKEALRVAEEGWEDGNGQVQHVIDDNFETVIKENENVLMMFYAPWCGHCKSMKPEYAKASEELVASYPNVKLASMDCVTNPETCQKFGVSSYPTIKLFNEENKSGVSFGGGREAKDITKFIKKKLNKANPDAPFENEPLWDENGAVIHMNEDHWASYRQANPHMFVMFYAPWCGHCKSMKPDFARASVTLEGKMPLVAVDCTEHADICVQFGVTGYPTVKYFSGSGDPEDYSGGRNEEEIVAFCTEKAAAAGLGQESGKEEL